MKLLVLAQTPPPVHGQSVMVQTLLDGLPERGISVVHEPLRLSRSSADIGRWRPGKILATLRVAARAGRVQASVGADALYYIPGPPGKRGALFRDWAILTAWRARIPRCVLHWHAVGLGAWIQVAATTAERRVTDRVLGRVDLSLVLGDALRADAALFSPRLIQTVPNGVPDPGAGPRPAIDPTLNVLFLGQCSAAKGLFCAAGAVTTANLRGAPAGPRFRLTVAGAFSDPRERQQWDTLAQTHGSVLNYVGPVDGAEKRRHLFEAHALILPTSYSAEGSPLVALEALAHDRPVVATDWRGLRDIVSPEVGHLVPRPDPAAFADALLSLASQPPAAGICRDRYLRQFTVARHLDALGAALRVLNRTPG